jgi:DNA helicase-2/ATP-dependent DNA helicase PcrA
MSFVPSQYQADIFDWISNGTGNAIVNAVAGSGKSTTLKEGISYVPAGKTVVYLAFNKSVQVEFERKIAGSEAGARCQVKTLNGLGHGALLRKLGKVRLDEHKYRNICKTIAEATQLPDGWDVKKYTNALLELTSHTMSSLTDPTDTDAMNNLVDHTGTEVPNDFEAFRHVKQIVELGIDLAINQQLVGFDDQIFLPAKFGWEVSMFDFVMVDECQDLSVAKLALVTRAIKGKSGRALFVGDPKQAIYGFAGADAYSYGSIKTKMNAKEFPLSVCYRCPTSVLDLARSIVPNIEAAPNASEGKVEHIKESAMYAQLRIGDLVLCRLTAPLIRTALTLISKRIPAHVKGREIGRQLTGTIRDAAKKQRVYRMDEFANALDKYAEDGLKKLRSKDNNERAVEAFQDRIDAIYVCWEASHAETIDGLCEEIESLFIDGKPAVELSTVHKAKGLEEDNVFIIAPDKMPLVWKGQLEWEFEQEMNIEYVAFTRAKKALFLVDTVVRG